LWSLAAVVLGIAAAMLPIAASYAKQYHLSLASAVGVYTCFLQLLLYGLAPATAAGYELLERVAGGRFKAFKVVLLLALPYLCYAMGMRDLRVAALVRLALIAVPVVAVYSAFPVSDRRKFTLQDLFAAIWLVAIVLFHLFQGIWNRPTNLDFMARLFVFTLGALCWTYIRHIPDLRYRLVFNTQVLLAAGRNFLFFAVIAIPLGMALGFTAWNPRWHGALDFAIALLEIFLFIALLEELFFRGFLQSLLQNSLRSRWRGQLVASSIFGLFHILHAPFPNWRYVILASIAGWFYGAAYREGGTLFASALLHATVDTVWRAFFTRG
jgi:membrane protease YdiL (CAAX protease family)